jgi:hypothetical protein
MEDHVLLKNFTLNYFRRFCGQLLLAAGYESLPVPKEHADRFARVEKHLDGYPIC